MDVSRPAFATAPAQSPPREADLPLAAAVRELFSGLRAGAADVADLVAAEAQVAVRLLVLIVLSAVGAAMLAIFAIAGLLATAATELIAHGVSLGSALALISLICAIACALLALQLRALSRRVLFGHSRNHLRGGR